RGNIRRFDLRGRVSGEDIVARGNTLDSFRGEYAWTNARTPQSMLAVGLQGDTVSVAGFAFDSVDARFGYRFGGRDGRVEVVVRQGDDRDYSLRGDFALDRGRRELRITSMALRFDTTAWVATRPALVHWHPQGLEVHTLELRSGEQGRIYVNGMLPTEGSADLEVAIDNLTVDDIAGLLQSDLDVRGVVSLSGRIRGTMRAPTFRGAFGVVSGTYRGTTLPELHGTFAYANRRLTTRVDAIREGGAPLAVVQGTVPIDLAFSGVSGRRLLEQSMALNIDADSLPLELIPYFTDAVSGVTGLAVGRVAIRGTLRRPTIIGALTVARGTVTLTSTGMRVSNITGSVRMLSDSIHIDSIVGRAYGPIRLRGHLAVGSWREPGFDLYLTGNDAEVLRNDRGRLRADLGLALTGPFREPYLSGQVTVTQGVVYAPDPTGKRVINAGDPALFAVVDTALTENRELFPVTSPFLQNLRMEVAVAVRRDTWVRSKDMNIEMYTEYPVFIRSYRGNMSLVGTVTTDRGEYSFLSKRFQISRGSATFIGGPEINPTLQVTGEYQVQLTGSPALNVRVLIGGTLKRPRLTLESDAQPPRSQSELLTMLAFGRSSASDVLQVEGTSLSSGVGAGDLVGIGSKIAVRRLAGIAVGVAIQELETEAGRGIGADVFDITPADVPESIEGGHT
ncbi:MAG TPA: translocation/assembly module TamB domain-containing protein, partial [Gemmatimonadaceae bacterium]|nr:translocation/assembly module TamB domain-containing protein [Gemmatimonadaceae bacterium]